MQEAVPSLGSDLLLYDAEKGELLALVEADWITAMRTGALAAAAAKELRKSNAETYGFIGLGNTARATLLCLLEQEPGKMLNIMLLRYKNQADDFAIKLQNEILFFELKLARISPEKQSEFLSDPLLAPYHHFLEKQFASSKYLLSPE